MRLSAPSSTKKQLTMPKYKGLFKASEGSIGDVTFAKTKDGYQMREKNEVSAEAIATSPTYQRVRENMAEFSRAGKAARLLRHSLRTLLQNAKDRHLSSRLVKGLMAVIKSDTTHMRGERTVMDGDVQLLKGFEFNGNADLATTLPVAFTTSIDRTTGALQLDVPSMVPLETLVAPAGATHYQIVCGGAAVDFDNQSAATDFKESAYLPWTAAATPALSLLVSVPAASTHPLFLVAGVQFFQEVNGMYYALKSGMHNALSLVAVEG